MTIDLHAICLCVCLYDRLSFCPTCCSSTCISVCDSPSTTAFLAQVLVQEGDVVAVGAPLFVMEAMKMEHTVVASRAGTVEQLSACSDSQVADGQVLMVISAPMAGAGLKAAATTAAA